MCSPAFDVSDNRANTRFAPTGFMDIYSKIEKNIVAGQSINREDALWLLTEADLLQVGKLADAIRRKKHPHNRVTFVVDRNVNYSNICESQCRFCAFYRNDEDKDAYLLDFETIFAKVQELVDSGGTQLLMQGGLHPTLKIEWFENLFRSLSECFPQVQIHSLSPAEVIHIAKLSDLTMEELRSSIQSSKTNYLIIDKNRKNIEIHVK